MKRVRKAKTDGVDSMAISDEGPNREEIPGAHSILEISGPTIPSPGPSGTVCSIIAFYLHLFVQTSIKAGNKRSVDGLESSKMDVCSPVPPRRSLEGLRQSWLAGTGGVPANTKSRPHHRVQHLAGCFC